MLRRTAIATLTSLALASASFAASAADHVFSNPAAITIPGTGTGDSANPSPSDPYPSSINVSGLSGDITHVSVTLNGLSHTWPGDLQVVLVAPGGQKIALMQRIGASGSTFGCSNPDLVAADLTFDAGAASNMNDCLYDGSGGTYLPTIGLGATLTDSPAPAPAGPYSADLTTLNGSSAGQNGNWNLYVSDHAGGDSGSMSGGWTLDISDAPTTTCTSEGYRGAQLTWCKNICENGLTGQVLDTWIHRWINRYRDLPYCAVEEQEIPIDET